jgi:FkbM family methyltransferase
MKQVDNALMRVRPASLGSILKFCLGIRRRVVETQAGRFYVDPVSNFGIRVQQRQSYEPELQDAVRTLLHEGDTFVDVGANEGIFSVIASKAVGATGRVVAIEPQSRLQSVLARNVRENSAFNIDVIQRAISDARGVATLSLSPDVNPGSSGLFRATRYSVPTQEVLQTTLGGLFRLLSLNAVKLIKMDIEGFGYEAVLGSPAVFREGLIQYFALELHPAILAKRGKSEQEILDFLTDCGYRRDDRFKTLVLAKQP